MAPIPPSRAGTNLFTRPMYLSRDDESDLSCVERCLGGDNNAFGTLIERYERPIYHVVVHMLGNPDDARDVCQQVFMKAFQHLSTFDRTRRFFSWLYRLAINESINRLKGRVNTDPLAETIESADPSPDEAFETAERSRRLRKAVMALPPMFREVIVLRHFLQMSYREVADALAVTEAIVKSRLFSARQRLRETLEGQFHAG